ncbi:MAG: protein kinase [Pseudomonadota bacterium]
MASAAETEFDPRDEADPCDDLAPGTQLLHGQYTIVDFLNAGGFGITYRAVDSLDRKVVIKECFPGAFCRRSRAIVQPRSRAHKSEFDGIVRLFVQEARSLSKLQHPNIVGVHQVFEENDTAYMALDFVEGRDLLEILEDPDTDLPPSQIVSILRDMLDAVGFVHAQGMLHRDISPDNILVDGTGKPVLIDFGAARQQAQKQSRVLSAMRVVKDGYSPQEFYITGSDQGPFSDLYALGASFYHLIAGEIPPDSQRRLTAIATSDEDPYQPLRGRFPDYDDRVLAAIDRALAILPRDRMQSAAEWLAAMDGKTPARTSTAAIPPIGASAAAPAKKSRAGLIGGVAVIAIAAVVGVVALQTDLLSVPDAPADPVGGPVAAVDIPGVLSDPDAVDRNGSAAPEPSQTEIASENVAIGGDVADTAFSTQTVRTPPRGVPVTDVPPPPKASAETSVAASTLLPPASDPSPAQDPADQVAIAPVEVDPPAPTQQPTPVPVDTPQAPLDPEAQTTVTADIVATPPVPTDPAGPGLDRTAAQADIPGWRDLPTISAPLPGAEIPEPVTLAGGWSVALPFEDLRIDADGRSHIVTLNGEPVSDRAEFNAVLAADYDLPALETLSIEIGVGRPGQSPSLVQTTTLPVAHYVSLPDGPTFRTALESDAWITRVVSIPENSETDLRPGDQLFASVDSGKRFDGPTDLRTLLEAEMGTDRQYFSFAVLRNGSNWVASLTRPVTN